jgi:hypothetical protein
MLSPAISLASFPVSGDTTQIQQETLEEYNLMLKNLVMHTGYQRVENGVIKENSNNF